MHVFFKDFFDEQGLTDCLVVAVHSLEFRKERIN